MHQVMLERLNAFETKQLNDHKNNISLAFEPTNQNKEAIKQKKSLEHALFEDIKHGGVKRTCQVIGLGVEIPYKDHEVSVFHMVISAAREDLLKLLLEGLVVEAAVYHKAYDDIRSSANEPEISSGIVKRKLITLEGEVNEKEMPEGLQSVEVYEIISYIQSGKIDQIITLLREWLMPLGIQVYPKKKQSAINSGICFFYAPVKDAILWYYQTSSDYYERTTKEIARQIELWDRRYGVTLAGAGKDWVNLWFHNLYISMEDFRWEAIEFCPQLVLGVDWLRAGNISKDGSGLIHFRWR